MTVSQVAEKRSKQMPDYSSEKRGGTPFHFNAVNRLHEFMREIDRSLSGANIDHYCSKFQGALMMIIHTEIAKDYDAFLLTLGTIAEALDMEKDEEYLNVVAFIHSEKQRVCPT